EPRNVYAPGDDLIIRVHVKNGTPKERLTLAAGAMRSDGTLCFAHQTQFAGIVFDFAEGYVDLHLDNLCLLSGEFTVPIWLFDENGAHRFQERPANENLIVQNRTKDLGLFLQQHRWHLETVQA
ncbi:MAG: hypothetical protein KDC48_23520, partial [Planctomycetes bacterium]|nr:hypothetical protein [Planctomycetota bacterium]